jgi:RNA polymerase sigma-70 factor (ECF subfamily)
MDPVAARSSPIPGAAITHVRRIRDIDTRRWARLSHHLRTDGTAAMTGTIELVKLAQGGDHTALDCLLGRYYERVRRIVRVRVSPGLRARIEVGDILQEVFLHAIQRFSDFEMRDEASLIHWLAQIAAWKIKDRFDHDRANKRDARREQALLSSAGKNPDLVDPQQSPSEAAASHESQELLEQCLDAMPEEYRELIVLRNFVGLDWEAIAQKTGRPSAGAARMKHQTAYLDLCKRLRSKGAGDSPLPN